MPVLLTSLYVFHDVFSHVVEYEQVEWNIIFQEKFYGFGKHWIWSIWPGDQGDAPDKRHKHLRDAVKRITVGESKPWLLKALQEVSTL